MDEKEWVRQITERLIGDLTDLDLRVEQGKKLPYAHEIVHYSASGRPSPRVIAYETDILISERVSADIIKPRIIIEAKIRRVTTHDAITYSEKAADHKRVHPYVRYGIILGSRKHYPLPGRLFRHGANFDFMQSFKEFAPNIAEWDNFKKLIRTELQNSRLLEEIIYNSRSKNRMAFTSLQKMLNLT